MGILAKIREMPDNKKKVFSLVTAAAITFVIVTVWISLTKTDTLAESKVNKLSSVSPWGMIKEEFSKAFSGFKEATENISTSTPLRSEATGGQAIPIEIIEATSSATSTPLRSETTGGQAN